MCEISYLAWRSQKRTEEGGRVSSASQILSVVVAHCLHIYNDEVAGDMILQCLLNDLIQNCAMVRRLIPFQLFFSFFRICVKGKDVRRIIGNMENKSEFVSYILIPGSRSFKKLRFPVGNRL